MGDTIALDDIGYMKTRVWRGETFDGMRDVFSSLCARDGQRSHCEAMRAILKKPDDASDAMSDLLVGQAVLTDRYFADCLLPLGDHLGDWQCYAHGIQALIDDMRLMCEALDLMVEGPSSRVLGKLWRDAPERRARDGSSCLPEIAQRLTAYEAILAMVLDIDDSVHARLRDVVEISLGNVSRLFESDVMGCDAPDQYLTWCHSVGGRLVMTAEYRLEPLFIVADASRSTATKPWSAKR